MARGDTCQPCYPLIFADRHRTREFWLNYVMDQAGPPAAGDVEGTLSFDGKLTQSGFVGHRRMIEPDHPLEQDLLSMGLDLLPECLQRWLKAKVWVE